MGTVGHYTTGSTKPKTMSTKVMRMNSIANGGPVPVVIGLALGACFAVICFPSPAAAQRPIDDVPWIAQGGIAPPMAALPAETGVNLRTSVGQWRDFNSQLLAARINDAQPMKPATVVIPKPPMVPSSPLEVWTTMNLEGFADKTQSKVKTGAGADYRLNKKTVLGIAVERADGGAPGVPALHEDKVAAKISYQATSMFSVDAQSHWATTDTTIGAGSARTETSAVTVAPRLKYPIKSNGQTFEPFVSMKDEISHATATAIAPEPVMKNTLSAGTGVVISRPNAYSMSVTADLEGIGQIESATVKSRFQLSVPLR